MELDLQRFYNINRRIVMWIVFFAMLLLLRDFFALVFMAFIFGFVMRKVAKFLVNTTRLPYWAAVVFPYLGTVALLVLLLLTAIPRLVDEGAQFSRRVPRLFETLADEVKKAAPRYGMEQALIKYVGTDRTQGTSSDFGEHETGDSASSPPTIDKVDKRILADKLQNLLVSLIPRATRAQGTASPGDMLRQFVTGVWTGTLSFLLAILLSFLIVLDFDRIGHELRNWRETPVGRFFHDATASVVEFSGVVGTAFQCQMLVALFNATVTCLGLFALHIQPLLLLTTIVFLFGLIPVLGVFISSVPIILIAFNNEGISWALLALGMIVIVHLLEAYVFNPRIYAARFHLNPVIVIIILLVAEKLFGVWGMLLGIPVTHYVLNVAQMPSTPRKRRGERTETE
ncbi:MAG TPA: AI-2E family transporter [Phycisphaerae bacterium]|nr:AI-2E family transporter [Phycisphaerae bacterium]HRY68814.1 AI-2E family transporter [Phycisphaerae bacterium]HSA27478.1 AI-2E family transporter [Phycisphaerae bacterium]